MASHSTIAKPYALAIFSHGQEQGGDALGVWEADLGLLAAIMNTDKAMALLSSPALSQSLKAKRLVSITGDSLAPATKRLLGLLAENKRLLLLPDIAVAFAALKADAENRLDIEITAAFPLSDAETGDLTTSLTKHFGRKVFIHTNNDPSLIAGALIRAGDVMLDASYRGRLNQLRKHLQAAS